MYPAGTPMVIRSGNAPASLKHRVGEAEGQASRGGNPERKCSGLIEAEKAQPAVDAWATAVIRSGNAPASLKLLKGVLPLGLELGNPERKCSGLIEASSRPT